MQIFLLNVKSDFEEIYKMQETENPIAVTFIKSAT